MSFSYPIGSRPITLADGRLPCEKGAARWCLAVNPNAIGCKNVDRFILHSHFGILDFTNLDRGRTGRPFSNNRPGPGRRGWTWCVTFIAPRSNCDNAKRLADSTVSKTRTFGNTFSASSQSTMCQDRFCT